MTILYYSIIFLLFKKIKNHLFVMKYICLRVIMNKMAKYEKGLLGHNQLQRVIIL